MPVKPKTLPPAADLWETFEYKPLTGELIRKPDGKGRWPKTGGLSTNGYWRIAIGRTSFNRSRMVWKWVSGKDPQAFIDHANQTRDDDRVWNLREVDECKSMLNRSAYGKSVIKENNRFRVKRMVNGKSLSATFNTEEEAIIYAKDLDARMNAQRRVLFDGQIRSGA